MKTERIYIKGNNYYHHCDLTKRNLYHGLANYLLIDALFLRYRYIGYFYKGKTKGFFIYQKLF
jgi:hypothetical protein